MLYRATITTAGNAVITDTYIIASSTMQVMELISTSAEIEADSQIRIVNLGEDPISLNALLPTTTEGA